MLNGAIQRLPEVCVRALIYSAQRAALLVFFTLGFRILFTTLVFGQSPSGVVKLK